MVKKTRGESLNALISKCEDLETELNKGDKKDKEEEEIDEFTRLKKLSSKQIMEIRNMIKERDELLGSSGNGGKAAVQLSSRIREFLRSAQETHKKMQQVVAQEEKDYAKKKPKLNLTQEDIESHQQLVELVSKHIAECQQMEQKRYTNRLPGRGKTAAGIAGKGGSEVTRTAEASDLPPIDLDPEVGEGLQQLRRNDEKLEEQLDTLYKGVGRLKNIAIEQSNEVKLQGVMIDQISDNMDKATDHLNDVNVKLKDTLARAGGATNIMVKLILLILLLSIAAYLYKSFA